MAKGIVPGSIVPPAPEASRPITFHVSNDAPATPMKGSKISIVSWSVASSPQTSGTSAMATMSRSPRFGLLSKKYTALRGVKLEPPNVPVPVAVPGGNIGVCMPASIGVLVDASALEGTAASTGSESPPSQAAKTRPRERISARWDMRDR
jgi:hypothetical protein